VVTVRDDPRAQRGGRSAGEPTDAVLLDEVRAGRREAYAELWGRHRAEARQYARALVGRDDADDVVDEAFTKVLSALAAGRGPTGSFVPYLMVSVRSVAYTNSGKRRHDARAVVPDVLTADGADAAGDGLDIREAFSQLPPRWRSVLWMAAIEGRTAGDIAGILGIQPAAASALLYRARRALRDRYEAASA
jgi:RNA polymerase sigma factor (sigma-70 family)